MCTESNEIMNLRSFKQKPHLSSLSPSQNVRAKFSKKFTSHFPKFDNVWTFMDPLDMDGWST